MIRAIVDPLASRLRDRTPKEICILLACSLFRRLVGLRALRVVTLEPGDLDEEFDLSELPLRGVVVREAAIAGLVDAHPALGKQFLARAREKGDWCYAIFDGERLASFGWYSQRKSQVGGIFDFQYSDDFLYMYHGYTDSHYRGLRLHAFGMAEGARTARRQGKRGLISLIEPQNHATVRSVTRLGFKSRGYLLDFKLGGRRFAVRSPGCRRIGCALVRQQPKR